MYIYIYTCSDYYCFIYIYNDDCADLNVCPEGRTSTPTAIVPADPTTLFRLPELVERNSYAVLVRIVAGFTIYYFASPSPSGPDRSPCFFICPVRRKRRTRSVQLFSGPLDLPVGFVYDSSSSYSHVNRVSPRQYVYPTLRVQQ